jgi:hypothetical protein
MGNKPGNKGGKGKFDAEAAQDMKFAEAMERDMERFSRDSEDPRKIDEDWKNHERYDGNKNIARDTEFGSGEEMHVHTDAAFINRMYMPYLGSGVAPVSSVMDVRPDKNSEFSAEIDPGRKHGDDSSADEKKRSGTNKKKSNKSEGKHKK